jgi:hypothetical protein
VDQKAVLARATKLLSILVVNDVSDIVRLLSDVRNLRLSPAVVSEHLSETENTKVAEVPFRTFARTRIDLAPYSPTEGRTYVGR